VGGDGEGGCGLGGGGGGMDGMYGRAVLGSGLRWWVLEELELELVLLLLLLRGRGPHGAHSTTTPSPRGCGRAGWLAGGHGTATRGSLPRALCAGCGGRELGPGGRRRAADAASRRCFLLGLAGGRGSTLPPSPLLRSVAP